jgi:NADH:ubiquinone oxidoreductase subunit 6 (subunit J)
MVRYTIMILTLAFLAVLFTSLSITQWGTVGKEQAIYEVREGLKTPESGIGSVGMEIFTIYVFAFEILALVLTAALVGAVYVAKKEAA